MAEQVETHDVERPARSGPQASPLRVLLAFLRLGLTAFGGPAMVAYIRDVTVRKRKWLSQESFQDGVALCQSIPGATAMQTAAYAGLRAAGPWGALAAFVGFGLPAFVLMMVLSAVYQRTRDVQAVLSAFRGLQVVVVALIAGAAVDFGRGSIRNWRDVVLAGGAAAILLLRVHPIVAIVGAGGVGLLLYRGIDLPGGKPSAGGPDVAGRFLRFAAFVALLAAAGLAAMFFLDRKCFDLALLMVRVDLFAFGGGFASVPLMLHEVVDVRGWLDGKTFMDGIALGQVTPGPIVITATFVGHQIAGIPGGIAGTLGIFTPSFLMVLVTVPYLDRLQRSVLFRRALRGILVSFVGLLLAVAVNFGRVIPWTIPSGVLAAAAFAALRLKIDILWVVLAGGLVSVFIL